MATGVARFVAGEFICRSAEDICQTATTQVGAFEAADGFVEGFFAGSMNKLVYPDGILHVERMTEKQVCGNVALLRGGNIFVKMGGRMRRAFLVGLLLWSVAAAWAAPRESAEAPATDERRALAAIKRAATGPWVEGDWAMKAVMSTGKGSSRVSVPVELLGGWTPTDGRWQRIRMADGRQWIIKGRAIPTVWELKPDGPHAMTEEERLDFIHDRVPLSWELFTMGFLSWPQTRYMGVQKVRARWCDEVELSGGTGAYAKALVWVDVEFGAPVEAELYDTEGRLVKTVRAVSVQKVQSGEWILKRWEAVDGISHAKVSVDVTAVALGGVWQGELMNETSGPNIWPAVPAEAWRTFE